ncbi:MAG: inositol monophosphatase [Acidobacteria bacterium]|nr:inositol monophosphatase [Acidobacteriota bacterium]
MSSVDRAVEAAKAGAEVLLKYWKQLDRLDATLKGRHDWVSKADRESEEAIVRHLAAAFPNDGFLGEETGATGGAGDRTWIIDPLDGTSNYLQHFPVWSISIALRVKGEMTAGVVYEPLRENVFVAERGSGAFLNGTRLKVSDRTSVDGSFLTTGFPFRAMEHVEKYVSIFRDVICVCKGVRRPGSAALDLAYTAAGVFDGFFELHLSPWDVAAGALLVREAGGLVSDFSGGERFWERGNIVGATPGVHRELLAMIARHTREDDLDR